MKFKKLLSLLFFNGDVDTHCTGTIYGSRSFYDRFGGRLYNNTSKTSFSGQTPNEGESEPQNTQWNVAPSIGYFLFNNFTLGIGLDYTTSTESREGEAKTKDSDLLFGPFARYDFPLTNRCFCRAILALVTLLKIPTWVARIRISTPISLRLEQALGSRFFQTMLSGWKRW